jgi:hypothetical protein
LSGLFSLGMIRSASGVAKSAFEALGDKAAALTKSASPSSFAETLSTTATADANHAEPLSRIRERLAKVVTESLSSIGVSLDPALTFVAGEDGQLHLEEPHPRAAEIEANLRDNPEVRSLAAQLLESSNLADRRLVLHSVSTP